MPAIDFGVLCILTRIGNVSGGRNGTTVPVCLSVVSELCPEDLFRTTQPFCDQTWYGGARSLAVNAVRRNWAELEELPSRLCFVTSRGLCTR